MGLIMAKMYAVIEAFSIHWDFSTMLVHKDWDDGGEEFYQVFTLDEFREFVDLATRVLQQIEEKQAAESDD